MKGAMSEHRVGDFCVAKGLKRISGILNSLGAMIAALAPAASAHAQVATGRRHELDRVQSSIEAAISAVEAGQHRPGHHFHVANIAPDVQSFDIEHAIVHPHQPLDVLVDVRASAQQGALLLSCSEFGLAGTLTLRIVGIRGSAEITVISGATALDLGQAVGTVSELTGVGADAVGTGVRIASIGGFGSDQFVAVQSLSPHPRTNAAGIYRMMPDNALVPDPTECIPFTSAEAHAGVWDVGQDLQAVINGIPATGHGTSLQLWSPQLRMDLTLSEGSFLHASHLGTFRAFQIFRD
jgi:hypothetical protein